MIFSTNKFLSQNKPDGIVRKKALCKDGFSISIQASMYHECNPRKPKGPYKSVELGYSSHIEILIEKYAKNTPSKYYTIYSYVPVKVVDEVIKKHGGIIGTKI